MTGTRPGDPTHDDGELAFIERLRALLPAAPAGQLWIGDDAAVLDHRLLLTTDILVEGVHFALDWCDADAVGWKALAVNLSDIAAMAGTPIAAVVSLVADPDRPGQADQVMAGLSAASTRLGCPIVGGDTSTGPALTVAVAVLGRAGEAGPVLRSGAQPGDTIAVTGELGAAASALRNLQHGETTPPGLDRLLRPVPRLAEAAASAALGATAMIDLSDGLAMDLRRVCEASECAAVIDQAAIPLFGHIDLEAALFGGDDYELLFTIPSDRLLDVSSWHLTPVTAIGTMMDGSPRITIRGPDGARPLLGRGYEHRIT